VGLGAHPALEAVALEVFARRLRQLVAVVQQNPLLLQR